MIPLLTACHLGPGGMGVPRYIGGYRVGLHCRGVPGLGPGVGGPGIGRVWGRGPRVEDLRVRGLG